MPIFNRIVDENKIVEYLRVSDVVEYSNRVSHVIWDIYSEDSLGAERQIELAHLVHEVTKHRPKNLLYLDAYARCPQWLFEREDMLFKLSYIVSGAYHADELDKRNGRVDHLVDQLNKISSATAAYRSSDKRKDLIHALYCGHIGYAYRHFSVYARDMRHNWGSVLEIGTPIAFKKAVLWNLGE